MEESFFKILSKLKFTGIGAVIGSFSGLFYATSGLFAQLLKGRVESGVISFFRTVFILVYAVGMVVCRKENILGYKAKSYIILVGMATINIAVIFAQNMAFQMINLSDAITLISSSSVFIVICNCVFFCQVLGLINIAMTIGCFTGAILCAQPDFIFHAEKVSADSTLNGYTVSIMVAVGWGLIFIMIKTIEHVDISTFLLLENGVALILLSAYLPFAKNLSVPEKIVDIVYLFCNSCFSLFASILLYTSLKLESAFMTSIGRTSEIVISYLFSMVIFHEDFNWMKILGSFLVMLSIIVRSLKGFYDDKKRDEEEECLIENISG